MHDTVFSNKLDVGRSTEEVKSVVVEVCYSASSISNEGAVEKFVPANPFTISQL